MVKLNRYSDIYDDWARMVEVAWGVVRQFLRIKLRKYLSDRSKTRFGREARTFSKSSKFNKSMQ